MGRFDALLNPTKTPPLPSPIPTEQAPHEETQPQEANKFVSKLVNQQTSKEANQYATKPAKKQISEEESQQTTKLVNQQTSKEANQRTNLPLNHLASKMLKKFGSYLTEESLRQLKRIALETDRKDYEVLQEAVDRYLERLQK